jgi:hypothetical protein
MGKSDIDDKALKILECILNGETREETAKKFGYSNWKSMDIYMRRRGMKWDSRRYIYYDPSEYENDHTYEAACAHPKISMIINMFDDSSADPMQIAKKAGFKDHHEMASYMSARGYVWSYDQNNYIKSSTTAEQDDNGKADEVSACAETTAGESNGFSKYVPLLETLLENKNKLYRLLQPSHKSIPRYIVPGICRTKSFYMSNELSQLVSEFSQKYNISQKEIIEAALIDFLKNHSFKDEVEHLLESH